MLYLHGMLHFWNVFLYQPVFNLLIWIYNNYTDHNFGWAVVYLTIILRIILLPFTLVEEFTKHGNKALVEELQRINEAFKKDPIMRKLEIRRILKKRKVRPWAKIIVLGVQVLVLILLYQVFLRGITGEKVLQVLYPSVDFPGVINTNFYGFDLGMRHELIWPGIVSVWLLLEIYFDYRKEKGAVLGKSDLVYFILFPTFVFLALWWLPMVKSLFILTSMLFSLIIGQLSKLIFRPKKAPAAAH